MENALTAVERKAEMDYVGNVSKDGESLALNKKI